MFFQKLLRLISPSLYLWTQKTEDLIEAHELAETCLYAPITSANWAAYFRMVKSRNRIEEELYRRNPNWRD